jgi:hypothetical protein
MAKCGPLAFASGHLHLAKRVAHHHLPLRGASCPQCAAHKWVAGEFPIPCARGSRRISAWPGEGSSDDAMDGLAHGSVDRGAGWCAAGGCTAGWRAGRGWSARRRDERPEPRRPKRDEPRPKCNEPRRRIRRIGSARRAGGFGISRPAGQLDVARRAGRFHVPRRTECLRIARIAADRPDEPARRRGGWFFAGRVAIPRANSWRPVRSWRQPGRRARRVARRQQQLAAVAEPRQRASFRARDRAQPAVATGSAKRFRQVIARRTARAQCVPRSRRVRRQHLVAEAGERLAPAR